MTTHAQASSQHRRKAGVLLHISSLPSAYYTGDLGVEAYRFVDFLHELGVSVCKHCQLTCHMRITPRINVYLLTLVILILSASKPYMSKGC